MKQLQVTEVANPLHMTSIPITITVKDLNDESPVFSLTDYTANVAEEVLKDTEILAVDATDGDAGDTLT